MAEQLDQGLEMAEAVSEALELVEGEISLLELTQRANANLSEQDIRKYVHFLVNGVKETDANVMVTRTDEVNVVPCFAGG